MVASLEEIIDTGVVEEEKTPREHTFRFAFSVLHFVYGEPYIYKQDIKTRCNILPTAWLLELKLEKEQDSNIANCTLTVKRTDTLSVALIANIEVSFSFIENPSYQLEQLFRDEFTPGQEMQKVGSDILPFPVESGKYIDNGITVDVKLTISCCGE